MDTFERNSLATVMAIAIFAVGFSIGTHFRPPPRAIWSLQSDRNNFKEARVQFTALGTASISFDGGSEEAFWAKEERILYLIPQNKSLPCYQIVLGKLVEMPASTPACENR